MPASTMHCRPWQSGGSPSLPRYLGDAEATRLIDSCLKDGLQGLRDRAIVLLLIRLGLRAGDIAGMRHGDFNWQDATLVSVRLSSRSHRAAWGSA